MKGIIVQGKFIRINCITNLYNSSLCKSDTDVGSMYVE